MLEEKKDVDNEMEIVKKARLCAIIISKMGESINKPKIEN